MTFPLDSVFSDPILVADAKEAAEDFLKLQGDAIPKAFSEMMKVQGFPSVENFEI